MRGPVKYIFKANTIMNKSHAIHRSQCIHIVASYIDDLVLKTYWYTNIIRSIWWLCVIIHVNK